MKEYVKMKGRSKEIYLNNICLKEQMYINMEYILMQKAWGRAN